MRFATNIGNFFQMVLAWEARLSNSQRSLLASIYKNTKFNQPDNRMLKMLELISKSKVSGFDFIFVYFHIFMFS